MGRMSDLHIGMCADAETVIDDCECFEEFCDRMIKINYLYVPSMIKDIWDEFHMNAYYKYGPEG